MRRIHTASDGTYGAEKVWRQLRREGIQAARCTVERLMRHEGLEGVRRQRTTIPGDAPGRPADLVDRDFTADRPNRLWVADFTYVMTWSGVVNVAFVIDALSRRIVGWKADTTMKTSLVLDMLEMALWSRDRQGIPLAEGMVHHNEAGSQTHRRRRRAVRRIGRRRLRQRPGRTTIGLYKTETINRRGPWRGPCS